MNGTLWGAAMGACTLLLCGSLPLTATTDSMGFLIFPGLATLVLL